MAMSNASNDGFKKSFKFCLGVLAGFFVIVLASAIFSATLYDFIPTIEPFMRLIGAAYILWLAWTILRDKPKCSNAKKSALGTELFLYRYGNAICKREGDFIWSDNFFNACFALFQWFLANLSLYFDFDGCRLFWDVLLGDVWFDF
ncbi:export protein, LysE family [Listeria rocourtiae FSL F6-920]|nr:export protein, LysE family [Listeria rocourtiae FSL F6-920]